MDTIGVHWFGLGVYRQIYPNPMVSWCCFHCISKTAYSKLSRRTRHSRLENSHLENSHKYRNYITAHCRQVPHVHIVTLLVINPPGITRYQTSNHPSLNLGYVELNDSKPSSNMLKGTHHFQRNMLKGTHCFQS